MTGPEQPSQPEHLKPLNAEELKKLHELFIRAQNNGQQIGSGLMNTTETAVNAGDSLQNLIARRIAEVTQEHRDETARNISLDQHVANAKEQAILEFEAGERMKKFRDTLGMITWPYAKGIRGLALELHNMQKKLPLITQTIETDTVDEDGKPGYHIQMSYKIGMQKGDAPLRMFTYTQNLAKGRKEFGDSPQLVTTFKPNGDIESIAVMYREISAGGVTNMGDITKLDHMSRVANTLRTMNLAFYGGYKHCALTLYFGDNKYNPLMEYSQGDSYENLEVEGTYIYEPEEDKFVLIEDQGGESEKKGSYWDTYYKNQRESAGPNAEGFVQLALQMLSLIPIS